MSSAARKSYVLGVLLALLAAFSLVVLAEIGTRSADPAPDGSGRGGLRVARPSVTFTIAGDISRPFSPGVHAPVNLELTNPHDYRLRITHLKVKVRRISAPRADQAHPCTVRDFAVQQTPGRGKRPTLRLEADSTRTLESLHLRRALWPRVAMRYRSVNQDGCKGASATLGYTGAATLGKR